MLPHWQGEQRQLHLAFVSTQSDPGIIPSASCKHGKQRLGRQTLTGGRVAVEMGARKGPAAGKLSTRVPGLRAGLEECCVCVSGAGVSVNKALASCRPNLKMTSG